MFSLYRFKPQLDESLRPLAQKLVNRGLTANRITLVSAAGSAAVGLLLTLFSAVPFMFWLLLLWLPVRVVLEAADGVVARDFMQESAQGAYFNEAGKLLSDALLFLPFAFVLPFGGAFAVAALVWLGTVNELCGLLGQVHGQHGRRYDGPLGLFDRAALLAVLALWYALAGSLNVFAAVLVWLAVAAAVLTAWQRFQNGLKI
ncbi:MAG: CDP-alcohol phosphatidyltransferase family protein [Conchiformibius sp.]|nr:CDP-alcohol phosphatidyltransferase family protein [Conchiformibius sp.]